MVNSKPKFLIKLKTAFLICCILILSLVITVNILLALYKGVITQTLNSHFFKPLIVKNIFYLPPNFIILKGLSVRNEKTGPEKEMVTVPLSIVSFSLSDIVLKRTISIPSVYSVGPTAASSDIINSIREEFVRILDFITHLPQEDLSLKVAQAKIKTIGKDKHPVDIKGGFELKAKDRRISVSGSLGENVFSLKGRLAGEQIEVENFKLDGGNINCQLWGGLGPGLVELKGFFLTGRMDPVKKFFVPGIFILDIDSRIKPSLPRVEIERLNFTINDNPVRLSAHLLLNDRFSCNLKLFSDFRSMDRKENASLKNTSLTASIISQKNNTIRINAGLDMDFLEQKKESLPLEKVKLGVKNLILDFSDPNELRIYSEKLNFFSKTSANSYNINTDGLGGMVRELDKDSKLAKFSSRFYGGILSGKAHIEMKGFTPVISAEVRVKDVDANKLDDILIHFSKVYGKLSSQMFFANYPELTFKGTLHIDNGYLNNFAFFDWLADLFEIPSLKKISFKSASCDFTADREGVGMYYMDMDSEDIRINGYFKLKEADMVSSKIYLSLRRKLLQKSPKFRRLLGFLDKKQDLVKFNFQLSGNLHKMNFRWLESDFKEELRKAIPDFAKKGFEEEVGRLIESIAEQ